MLPPPAPGNGGYTNVKREGIVAEDDILDEDDENDNSGPSYAALGGRPRSVDFEKADRQQKFSNNNNHHHRNRRSVFDDMDHHEFVVKFSHVHKRATKEELDVETTRVIQVCGYFISFHIV